MYVDYTKEIPTILWSVNNVFDNRGLDLDYPEKMIRGIKRFFYDKSMDELANASSMVIYIQGRDGKGVDNSYYDNLLPDTVKELRSYFDNRRHTLLADHRGHDKKDVIIQDNCPKSKDLAELLLSVDKYFNAVLRIRNWLPRLHKAIKECDYTQIALEVASLSTKYNVEILDLINDHLFKYRVESGRSWYQILLNKAYLFSDTPYVAIRIAKFTKEATEDPDELAIDTMEFETYSALDRYRSDKLIASGSFLQDCQNIIAYKKKENIYENNPILDFHDLIKIGPFTDKILSIPILNGISKIFGHSQWIEHFFFAVALAANKKIKINQKHTSKEVMDTTKIPQYDLFLLAVEFLDKHYQEITISK